MSHAGSFYTVSLPDRQNRICVSELFKAKETMSTACSGSGTLSPVNREECQMKCWGSQMHRNSSVAWKAGMRLQRGGIFPDKRGNAQSSQGYSIKKKKSDEFLSFDCVLSFIHCFLYSPCVGWLCTFVLSQWSAARAVSHLGSAVNSVLYTKLSE